MPITTRQTLKVSTMFEKKLQLVCKEDFYVPIPCKIPPRKEKTRQRMSYIFSKGSGRRTDFGARIIQVEPYW